MSDIHVGLLFPLYIPRSDMVQTTMHASMIRSGVPSLISLSNSGHAMSGLVETSL